jgi:hypothetical protein
MAYYGESRHHSKRDRPLRPGYIEETYVSGHEHQGLAPQRFIAADASVEDLTLTRDYPPRDPRLARVDGLRRTRSVGTHAPYYYADEYDRVDDRHRSRRHRDRRK